MRSLIQTAPLTAQLTHFYSNFTASYLRGAASYHLQDKDNLSAKDMSPAPNVSVSQVPIVGYIPDIAISLDIISCILQ